MFKINLILIQSHGYFFPNLHPPPPLDKLCTCNEVFSRGSFFSTEAGSGAVTPIKFEEKEMKNDLWTTVGNTLPP